MLVPSRYPQLVRYISLLSAGAQFVLSIIVFFAYEFQGSRGLRFGFRVDWLENVGFLGKHGISLHLAVDGIAAPLVMLTGLVIFAAVFVSWNISYRNKDFFVLLFLLVAGVFGVFESQDLFFLFFWYEVAVLPMYLLIAVWGASSDFGTFTRTKEYGAMKLTLMLVAGSVLVFIGIFALFVHAGAGTFDMTVIRAAKLDPSFQKWC